MDNINYFRELFESISDFRKVILLMFLVKNDADLLRQSGYLENDINRLNKDIINLLLEQNEDNLIYNKNKEESVIGINLIK